MTSFSDYFSGTAPSYAQFRPRYPDHLFDWLSAQVQQRTHAWDCGTGSGQAAHSLASHFDTVVATDPSNAQIAQAPTHTNVHYAVMTAERTALRPHSMHLVTVAQALHWFELEAFYTEVRRVLHPGGVIAVWNYALCTLGDTTLDERINNFYRSKVGPWWPPERALVDAGYRTLVFPFRELAVPSFEMSAEWTLEQFAGYVSTWSAVTRYRSSHGTDPLQPFIESLEAHWGEPGVTRRVSWPLEVRAGTVY